MPSLSTVDVFVIALTLGWPFALPIFLIAIALLWKKRRAHPKTFTPLVIFTLFCSAISATFWLPEWHAGLKSAADNRFWGSVDAAASSGHPDDAERLLNTRPDGFQKYVERAIYQAPEAVDARVLAVAFAGCAELLSDPYAADVPLHRAIDEGQSRLVTLWLAARECVVPGRPSRHDRLAASMFGLVPHHHDTSKSVDDERRLEAAQAAALRSIVERYPDLFDIVIDKAPCAGRSASSGLPPCTLLQTLLGEQHREGLRQLMPLDPNAGAHLREVAWSVLRGDAAASAAAARRRPDVLLALLPELLATAPYDSLRAALRAAPPDETALLTPKAGDTQYQSLWPLFEGAERQDRGEAEWRFVGLVLDMFPTRSRELGADLIPFSVDVALHDPRASALLARLQSEGMDCERLLAAAKRFNRQNEELAALSTQLKCEWVLN